MTRKVYLDSAATTYVSSEVLAEMMPCFNSFYGNSASAHSFGRDAQSIVDRARDRISKAIAAERASEIYFTASGTEANNLAVFGIARANKTKGKHIITSAIEHESVLECVKTLEKEGFEVTYIPTDAYGIVSLASIIHHIRKDTILISVMAVNNEIGTIQNIKAISKTAHENGIIFHTDATSGLGNLKIDVQDMEIDAMTISAHKIYGPKGIGALYVNNKIAFESLIKGGEQERKKRSGTLNVPAIAGFGKACELAVRDMNVNIQKLKIIKNYLIANLSKNLNFTVNGHPQQTVHSILSLTFKGIDAQSLMMLLDMDGIAVSMGAACASNAVKASYVLGAIGLSDEDSHSTLRISLSKSVSKSDIDYFIEIITKCVKKLEKVSPIHSGRK